MDKEMTSTYWTYRLGANVSLLEHVLEPSCLLIKSSSDDGFHCNDTYKYVLCADVPKLE